MKNLDKMLWEHPCISLNLRSQSKWTTVIRGPFSTPKCVVNPSLESLNHVTETKKTMMQCITNVDNCLVHEKYENS